MDAPGSDQRWMRAALALARRGLGRVAPNPAVGCILVKDGIVVGRGWTQPGGRPHAEVEAIAQAGPAARGATAYVSLEPCAHHGKTPPCAAALVDAGIARVVAAVGDPDPRVAGAGMKLLQAAGVDTRLGMLAGEARTLNAGFFLKVLQRRPYITLKLATTLDGRIATRSGASQWITGEQARAHGHFERARHDAILVGAGTLRADDPELTCRLPGLEDRSPQSVVMKGENPLPKARLLARGAWVMDRMTPAEVVANLAERGITRLLIEGGARIAAAFIAASLIDRILWYRAGRIFGADGLSALAPLAIDQIDSAPTFALAEQRQLGQDLLDVYLRAATLTEIAS